MTHDQMNRDLGEKYAQKYGRAWCMFCFKERSTEGGSRRKMAGTSRFCCRSCTERRRAAKAARK